MNSINRSSSLPSILWLCIATVLFMPKTLLAAPTTEPTTRVLFINTPPKTKYKAYLTAGKQTETCPCPLWAETDYCYKMLLGDDETLGCAKYVTCPQCLPVTPGTENLQLDVDPVSYLINDYYLCTGPDGKCTLDLCAQGYDSQTDASTAIGSAFDADKMMNCEGSHVCKGAGDQPKYQECATACGAVDVESSLQAC